jgi:hypothetical protein
MLTARTNYTVSKLLYDAYPESACATNDDDWNPLHYAYLYDTFAVKEREENFLFDLVERYPKLLEQRSVIEGITPVMVAMKHRLNDIKFLLKTNPDSFLLRNNRLENVLHTLCIYKKEGKWWNYVELVANKFPELLYQKDNKGKTPIDYGCEDIGYAYFHCAKEMFLSMCLKFGPLESRHWNIFKYPSFTLSNILGMLIKRNKEEAKTAMKFIRKPEIDKIQFILKVLHRFDFLEPEHREQILSSCYS